MAWSRHFPPNEGSCWSRTSGRCVCCRQGSRVVDDVWVSWGPTRNLLAPLHSAYFEVPWGAPRPSARRRDAREVVMQACVARPALPGRPSPHSAPLAAPFSPGTRLGAGSHLEAFLLLPSGVQPATAAWEPCIWVSTAPRCCLPRRRHERAAATGAENLPSGPTRRARTGSPGKRTRPSPLRAETAPASRCPPNPPRLLFRPSLQDAWSPKVAVITSLLVVAIFFFK